MKQIFLGFVVGLVLTFPNMVKAQLTSGSQDLDVTLSQTQSQAVAACVEAVMSCVKGGCEPSVNAHTVCDKAPPVARKKIGNSAKKVAKNHSDVEYDLHLLKGRVKVLEDKLKDAGSDDVSAIRAELAALRQELKGLGNGANLATKAELESLRNELREFIAEDSRYKEILEQTQLEDNREIKQLLERVSALEANLDPFELGIYAGVEGLTAKDGTKGSTFVLRLEPTFRVTPKVDLIGHVSALISNDRNPLGAQVGGAIGVRASEIAQVRFGASYAGIGYNETLKAQVGFLTGDLGLRLTAKNGFAALVNLGIGPKFDGNGNTSLGFTGMLGIGYNR